MRPALAQFQMMMATAAQTWTPTGWMSGVRGSYWDPNTISSLFQDASGTIPVTSDGDPVGLIRDLSGNGNHASQSTSGSRPTYKIDGAGIPYIQFSGSHYLATAANTTSLVPGTDNITIVLAMLSSGAGVPLARSLAAGLKGRYWINDNGTNLESLYNGYAFVSSRSITRPTTTSVITSELDRAAPSLEMRVNAVAQTGTISGMSDDKSVDMTPNLRTIIGAYNNSSDTGVQSYFTGRFYGAMIRLAALDATGRSNAEQFFMTRLGL